MTVYNTYTEVPAWLADFVVEAEAANDIRELSLDCIAALKDEYEAYLNSLDEYHTGMNTLEMAA